MPAYSYFSMPKVFLAPYQEQNFLRRNFRQLGTVDVLQRIELLPMETLGRTQLARS